MSPRLVTLALLALVAACSESRERSDQSHFSATTSEGLSATLSGAARYWCVDRPLKMCGIHLYPTGKYGDSLNFTITNTTRPKPGTYEIQPELDPAGEKMRVNYISGTRGKHQNFVGRSGKVVISESSASGIVASFEWEGLGVDALPNGVNPPFKVTGSFKAECDLHLRAAYTCD